MTETLGLAEQLPGVEATCIDSAWWLYPYAKPIQRLTASHLIIAKTTKT